MRSVTAKSSRSTCGRLAAVFAAMAVLGCQPRPGDAPTSPRPLPAATELTPDHHPPARTPEN